MYPRINHILPSWTSWFFPALGIVFGEYRHAKIFLAFVFHTLYITSCIIDRVYVNTTLNGEFIGKVMNFMILIESTLLTVRLFWNLKHSEYYSRIVCDISSTASSVDWIGRRTALECSQIFSATLFVCFEVAIILMKEHKLSLIETVHHTSWILVTFKHALEGEFLTVVLGRIKDIFNHLNKKLRNEKDYDENGKNKLPKMNRIREISCVHFQIVDLVESFSSTFTLDTYLWLIMNLFHLINAANFMIDSVLKQNFSIYLQIWLLREITNNCFIIFWWTSLSNEVNSSVNILHDIWNKYTETNQTSRRLHYFQFISMRLLSTKLKFTAYGFFRLDWTFLHTGVSMAATYIIILIQLRT